MKIEVQKSGELVQSALAFRSAIMHESFGVDPNADRDEWDAHAWHIMAVDNDQILGYYRAIQDSSLGFYTESEFDLGPLSLDRTKTLEIGRACAKTTTPIVIISLWKAVLDLAAELGCDQIMGAASLKEDQTDVTAVRDLWRAQYGYLDGSHAVPLMPYSRPAQSTGGIPKLIKLYEKIGARVVSDPSWDPEFCTADVVTILDIGQVSERWISRLIGD
jgi:putative hemolysin